MKYLKYILILFFFILITVYAQITTRIIDIKNFSGVISNYDPEDLPQENFVELKNLRPVNGKLVKTFEFGINNFDVKPVGVDTIYNLVTYIEPHLTFPTGYEQIIYFVDDDVAIMYWDETINDWTYYGFSEQFYHKNTRNPVVQADGVIRFLPGNVGKITGHEAKGIWIGYSDTTWVFDHNYQRPGAIQAYHTGIDSFGAGYSLEFIPTKLDSGTFEERKNYKYSLVYDGIQETLLQDMINVEFTSKQYLKLDIKMNNYQSFENTNRRITSMNIYRSDGSDSIYNKIHTIDFLRDSLEVFKGDSIYNGNYYAYIPKLSDYSFTNNVGYKIRYGSGGGDTIGIGHNLSGTGHKIFKLSTPRLTETFWNHSWSLYQHPNVRLPVYFNYPELTLTGNLSGLFAGKEVIITDKSFANNILGKGGIEIKTTDTTFYKYIEGNYNQAILFKGDSIRSDSTNKKWKIVCPSIGNYYFTKKAGTLYSEWFTFFDTGLTEGEEHPLADEISIKVNGKYAKIISNRLWQGNIVLDPGGKNEVHNDWVSYSEIGQYDVNPVSNVISFANQGIGEITGIEELFGYPVILKKNNVSIINIKDYPLEPAKWNIIESVHNIGNISDNGVTSILGHIYLPCYDGIYEFAPNDLAESSTTPSRIFKITEPIDDKYMALSLTAKTDSIISEYNQKYNEIIFKLGSELWAYSLLYKTWRELDITSFTPTIFCLDQNANILAYNSYNKAFYNSDSTGNARAYLQTKTFTMVNENIQPLKYLWLTFKTHVSAGLQIKPYFNGSLTPATTLTLTTTSSDSIQTSKVYLGGYKGQRFNLVINNAGYSDYLTEIYRIRLEYEGDQ